VLRLYRHRYEPFTNGCAGVAASHNPHAAEMSGSHKTTQKIGYRRSEQHQYHNQHNRKQNQN
jgi:hypothetical protein